MFENLVSKVIAFFRENMTYEEPNGEKYYTLLPNAAERVLDEEVGNLDDARVLLLDLTETFPALEEVPELESREVSAQSWVELAKTLALPLVLHRILTTEAEIEAENARREAFETEAAALNR